APSRLLMSWNTTRRTPAESQMMATRAESGPIFSITLAPGAPGLPLTSPKNFASTEFRVLSNVAEASSLLTTALPRDDSVGAWLVAARAPMAVPTATIDRAATPANFVFLLATNNLCGSTSMELGHSDATAPNRARSRPPCDRPRHRRDPTVHTPGPPSRSPSPRSGVPFDESGRREIADGWQHDPIELDPTEANLLMGPADERLEARAPVQGQHHVDRAGI